MRGAFYSPPSSWEQVLSSSYVSIWCRLSHSSFCCSRSFLAVCYDHTGRGFSRVSSVVTLCSGLLFDALFSELTYLGLLGLSGHFLHIHILLALPGFTFHLPWPGNSSVSRRSQRSILFVCCLSGMTSPNFRMCLKQTPKILKHK